MNELLVFDVKWAWPLVSVVDIKVLKLRIVRFESLEVINHYLNKFHFENFASLVLETSGDWSRTWFKTWLSSILIDFSSIFWNGDDQFRFVTFHFPPMIVELISNVQNFLEMSLFELSFQRFFNKIFGIQECRTLLSLNIETNALIDGLLELK